MKRYAEDSNYWKTTIAPAKSQGEIRQLLENFGATNPAIMQGQVRGQPAWMVRFDWHGYSYRYTLTPLECKEPDRIDFFGWKRHSHTEQARFQMGREAVDFMKAVLVAVKRRDNLETIVNSLKRVQHEDGAGNLVAFRIVTTEPYHIHFKGEPENSRLYSTTFTVNNNQAARLKSIGWHSLPCDSGFGFYQEWRAKNDEDRMCIAEEVIRTFTEVYGLTSNQLLEVDIRLKGIPVESISANRCEIVEDFSKQNLHDERKLGKLIFENGDLREDIPIYWEVKSGEIANGSSWRASLSFGCNWNLPEKAQDLVLQYLQCLTTTVELQISDDTVAKCGIVMEEYESMEDFISWGAIDVVSPDLGRAYQEDGTLWGNIKGKEKAAKGR